MKVSVKETFIDKFSGVAYHPGETLDIKDEKRIKDLVDRGLIYAVKIAEAKKTTARK